jgi:hypothetical protein
MIIVKTASDAGAVFNSRDFESMNIATTLVTANFRTVDSGDTPTRDALALNCTAGTEHEVARGLLDLIKSERTVVLDDVNDDFAGLADVTSVNAATINGVPAVSGFHVIEPATGTLSVADSGAIVILNDDVDLKLPTPAVGLEYTFVLDAAMGANGATITSTTDGSSASNLFFGIVDVNDATVQVANNDVITFVASTATEGDTVNCKCVSATTTTNSPTWLVTGAAEASGSVTFS